MPLPFLKLVKSIFDIAWPPWHDRFSVFPCSAVAHIVPVVTVWKFTWVGLPPSSSNKINVFDSPSFRKDRGTWYLEDQDRKSLFSYSCSWCLMNIVYEVNEISTISELARRNHFGICFLWMHLYSHIHGSHRPKQCCLANNDRCYFHSPKQLLSPCRASRRQQDQSQEVHRSLP